MTSARLNRIVTLAGAGMILCWFDILNSLIMLALSRMPLPVTKAALILFLSGFVSFVVTSWSLRRLSIIALHGISFLAALAIVLHSSGDPAYPFYNFTWVTREAAFSWAFWQWLKFLVNFICAGVLYYLGCHLYARRIDFYTVTNRLDIGISVFFVVLIVKLIAEHKGVVIPFEHSLSRQLACFMMLGLFSIGVVRNRASHRDSTISYDKGAGLVLSFGLLAAVFGTAVVMLFLPDLIEGALWGKKMLGRSWPWIEHLATFFVNADYLAKRVAPYQSNAGKIYDMGKPSFEMTKEALNPFYLKMVFHIGAFYALVVLWFAFEWVLRKPDEKGKRPGPWVVLRLMARRLKRIFERIIRLLFSRRDALHRVEQYYRLLQKWGARSGLPRVACETPREYGTRLARNFPDVAREIKDLIVLFNQVRYGGIPAQREQFKQIQADWKRLRSPALWPVRARLWLFRARG